MATKIGTDLNYKHKVVWSNVAFYLVIHILCIYGIKLAIFDANKLSMIWGLLGVYAAVIGIGIGAHRMYSHRSFKATFPLRLVLVALQTVAGQNSMLTWVRDHRLHHKFSDTDADPHSAGRGFFFSHMGWLMCRKHPAVHEKGRFIDVSDVQADPIVRFQKRHYLKLYAVLAIAIPVAVPMLCWNETFLNSLMISYFMRWVLGLHLTWLVNSAAHRYGTRPYDKNLYPVESWIVSLITLGDGWHNYHHAFPWDYKSSEYGLHINISTSIIEICEKLGLASDLKTVSQFVVEKRILRTGDGSHQAQKDTRRRGCDSGERVPSDLPHSTASDVATLLPEL